MRDRTNTVNDNVSVCKVVYNFLHCRETWLAIIFMLPRNFFLRWKRAAFWHDKVRHCKCRNTHSLRTLNLKLSRVGWLGTFVSREVLGRGDHKWRFKCISIKSLTIVASATSNVLLFFEMSRFRKLLWFLSGHIFRACKNCSEAG